MWHIVGITRKIPNYLEKNLSHCTLSTRIGCGSKPGLCGGRPVTNRLSRWIFIAVAELSRYADSRANIKHCSSTHFVFVQKRSTNSFGGWVGSGGWGRTYRTNRLLVVRMDRLSWQLWGREGDGNRQKLLYTSSKFCAESASSVLVLAPTYMSSTMLQH